MYFKPLFIALTALFLISCSSPQPTKLRVDYIREPQLTRINSDTPILSWQLAPKADAQSAYQIIVSTNEACLEGDLWDSGKVESDNNYAVVYTGRKLEQGESYHWKIRYWDLQDQPSGYSKPQKFTVASNEQRKGSVVSDNPLLRREDIPVEINRLDDAEYQFDFGRSAFGTIKLKLKVCEDATLTLRVGEQLTSDGVIESKPKGTIRYQEIEVKVKKGVDEYQVLFVADKRNSGPMAIPVSEQWGVIMPYRYVEVSGLGANDINSVELKRDVMYGYREELGSFTSSNSLLDSIWEICRYTIQATDFLGYYIDGDRERIPYEADAYLNQLSHYCVDSEYAIGKKTLEYFMSHATWPTEWLLHTIMIAYQDYIYTGDVRLIEQYYDILKAKTLYELGREDGLISAQSEAKSPEYLQKIGFKSGFSHMDDIVDWPKAAFTKDGMEVGERDGHEMLPINTVVNCFHYNAIEQMSKMAAVVGKSEDSEFFAALAHKVRASINEKLFDAQRGVYIDGEGSHHSSLHSNMVALAFDVIEEENIGSVAEFIKSRGMACSVYGAQYLFEALYKAGEGQYALDLMTNKSDRGWYNMIRVGSTMTLEAWDIKYKGNLDWNHAWGAAPANIIPRYMWGITPTMPGYKSAVIKPQLANLTRSEIAVPTLQGVIKGSFICKNGEKVYTILLPSGMNATFVVVDNATSVEFNGESYSGKCIELHRGENRITIR